MRRLPVKSLTSYLDAVRTIRETFVGNDPTTPVWFRGHRDSSWKLLPTLYRGNVDPHWERELLRDFKLRSRTFLSRPPALDLEWLYVMRHHGIHTRILDWSESPLVALFFALHESGSTASCVWMLRPWSLNESSIEWQSVPTSDSEVLSDYTLHESGGEVARSVNAVKPVAVRPQHAIHRAVGQSGMFTIHGKSRASMESMAKQSERDTWLQRVEIDGQFCERVFRELFEAGITTSSIFPDLDGLAADLSYRYSNRAMKQPAKRGRWGTRPAKQQPR